MSNIAFFLDLRKSLIKPSLWFYSTWVAFLIKYRRTSIGPLWVILAPALFVLVIGRLFAAVSAVDPSIFIPHLTVGFVTWSIIQSSVSGSSLLFFRSRAQIMQGKVVHTDIILKWVGESAINFGHQTIVIIGVLVVYQVDVGWHSLMVIPGLICFFLHALWATTLFSILGARYRDVSEMLGIAMRIAFLATPIIWMVGAEGGRGAVMGFYALFNPFYHAIEVVRAPLIGLHASALSWGVNIAILMVGFGVAAVFYERYRKLISVWV